MQINLGHLKSHGKEIGAFLEEKLAVPPTVEGGKIILGDESRLVRVQDVKTYLKRYLHREGLKKESRVLVEKGQLNIVHVEREEE